MKPMKSLITEVVLFTVFVVVSSYQCLATAGLAAEGKYKIDSEHSNIGFEITHIGVSSLLGRFNKFQIEGTLNLAGQSKISAVVDANSIDTKVAARDQHLKSPDFFNTTQFPSITFNSSKFEFDADGNPSQISGDLSLHGQTRPVIFQIIPLGAGTGPLGDQRVGYKATGTIRRSEFGMQNMLNVASDQVVILLNIEAIKL